MKEYIRTDLFPSTIEVSEIGRKLTKKEHTLLTNMPCHKNYGNLTSENNYVLELPELAKLKDNFMEAVQHYMDTIACAKPDVKAYITQSWVNYTGKGQFHHKHSHKNSYLSGVFYVNAEESVDKIKFYNEGYLQLDFNPTEWNIRNAKSWWYPVKTGRLIIFPSHLAHSVELKEEPNVRISLSFNTFLKGNLGDNIELSEVILP